MALAPITAADLLELWRRIFPKGYTTPIEDSVEGRGLDIFVQQTVQFERVAEAIDVTTQAYYLRPHSTQTSDPAYGERAATSVLSLSRLAPVGGPLTVVRGIRVQAQFRDYTGVIVGGSEFEVTEDTTIPAGSLGPVDLPVQCTRPGYQGNIRRDHITAFVLRGRSTVNGTITVGDFDANEVIDDGRPDRFTPGHIGQYVRFSGVGPNTSTYPRLVLGVSQGDLFSTALLDGPALALGVQICEVEEFEDVGLVLTQPTASLTGRHGWLDAIARDHGTGRQFAETDEQLRLRLGSLEDIVSPAAILRAAARVLTPLGIPYRLLETRDVGGLRGFTWDLDHLDNPDPVGDTLDFSAIRDGEVLLSVLHSVRFFILLVGIRRISELGAPYDFPYPDNAWDLMVLDGYDPGYRAAMGSLYEAIERARMAGVGWRLMRDPTM